MKKVSFLSKPISFVHVSEPGEAEPSEPELTKDVTASYKSCRSWLRHWLLLIVAGLAVTWIVHRAMVQSITLDEANTFRYWVAPNAPTYWVPHANNHVLNSIMIRLAVWLFGLSHLTMRLPALLGGVLYIAAVCGFCIRICRDRVLTFALFVCFVYNPFIMDYLVAARGYGLALGFFTLAIYIVAQTLVQAEKPGERETLSHVRAVSICAAVSFCANFAFAYANVVLLLVFVAWAYLEQRNHNWISYARLTFVCAFPALLIVFLVAGSVLVSFPRDQLIWGAHSLRQTWHDIRAASFCQLNSYLVNPLLARFLQALRPTIVGTTLTVVILYGIMVLWVRRFRYRNAESRLRLAGLLGAVFVLTILAHWLQFKFLKIPLPFERTSLFFVPLATAIVGAVLSIAPSGLLQRVVHGVGVLALCISGFYFMGALRDSYFQEWRICADLKDAFPVIHDQCRRAHVHEVICDLNYTSTLDFYKALNKVDDIEFPDAEKIPSGKPIYVLPEGQFRDFIRKEGLQTAYHGQISDLVVVVRPDASANLSGN